MDEVIERLKRFLNNQNFEYYQKVFGYSKWETIKKTLLDTYYGCSCDFQGWSCSPKGITVHTKYQEKKFSVEEVKNMIGKEEQLRLF